MSHNAYEKKDEIDILLLSIKLNLMMVSLGSLRRLNYNSNKRMIRKILHQSLRVPLTFKNKATIFNGEFDPSKDYYLILGVSQKA